MKSSWNDLEAAPFLGDPVALRAYTSRLLGREPALVLHGGGNTSVKVRERDFFGDEDDLLYVKGSGWDLATIQPAGFAPVRMAQLLRMAALPTLGDSDMVRLQRTAMTDPGAPNPSVEAILHALVPFRYVDHTHADAVVALSNTPDGERRLRELYGDRVLLVPYVMPGFVLARRVFELTRDVDWSRLEGLVLLNHGVFTFADDARQSYERMIALVTEAERALDAAGALAAPVSAPPSPAPPLALAALRREVSRAAGVPLLARLDARPEVAGFSARPDALALARGGTATPDHVLHMKPWPLAFTGDPAADVTGFAEAYRAYFAHHASATHEPLDPAPRWAVWPGAGLVAFGASAARLGVVRDVAWHTVRAMQWAAVLGGWRPVSEADLFDVEYWELEQAKLGKAGAKKAFEGRVALVTGAASGIGRATALALRAQGAAVAAIDSNPAVIEAFAGTDVLPLVADLRDTRAIDEALTAVVHGFGGLDLLVSNAGTFPAGAPIAELSDADWQSTLDVNLTTHQRVLRAATPFLALGLDPAVVVVGSKNVPAPGPGVSAYSVAKAGLTQLARVAALELAPKGIRVNVVHPDAVFDTGIWPAERVAERAARYGLTPEQYKRRNLLGADITSADVAALVASMLGPAFGKTTGAQVPIDGGSDRVI